MTAIGYRLSWRRHRERAAAKPTRYSPAMTTFCWHDDQLLISAYMSIKDHRPLPLRHKIPQVLPGPARAPKGARRRPPLSLIHI